jgi:hypothetical protein
MSRSTSPCGESASPSLSGPSGLAALDQPLARTLTTLLRASDNVRTTRTKEGRACKAELDRLIQGIGSPRPGSRSDPAAGLRQAEALLERTRFDVRCNPEAITAVRGQAVTLRMQCARYPTHFRHDFGSRVDRLILELDQLASRSGKQGVKISTVRDLHQRLDTLGQSIEARLERVDAWARTAARMRAASGETLRPARPPGARFPAPG